MTERITLTSSDLQRRGRKVLDAVMVGKHVELTRWNDTVAIVVGPDWYAQALRAMSVCDAMAPREESAE